MFGFFLTLTPAAICACSWSADHPKSFPGPGWQLGFILATLALAVVATTGCLTTARSHR